VPFFDMKKGEDTKIVILEAGLNMASKLGLENVTIGSLAKVTNMSKSGLFAHFLSKENLQLEILKYAAKNFSENVIVPALKTEAGINRIKKLVNNWNDWGSKISGGCILVSASTDFSERPGNIRTCLLNQQEEWIDCLKRIAQSAIRVGDFKEDIDCEQFAFELYSLLLGFYYYYRLLHDTEIKKRQEASLEQLIEKYRNQKS
jgi:AcrR family transcriptional regulator